MLKIVEGSIVAGRSGKLMKVIAIEGEVLTLCAGEGEVRAKRSAIVHVLSPPPVEPTYYIGHKWQKQYGGMPLKLHPELRDGCKRCFIMPDGYLTTWLEMSEVR
jgi:hypothetical protein